ncbi:oxysterol-binding protein-related protein [Anaeramoeba flamelloides]|uniref:Oxysterol-binding protein-related protein n=1 Tax=Anaeramoeba flamelloides TaxID=1746091 RepID=A0AAV8A9Y6_9EUKA|nr:oxysterol-binding protein-related protein [Anaeramoeba flamelloides]
MSKKNKKKSKEKVKKTTEKKESQEEAIERIEKESRQYNFPSENDPEYLNKKIEGKVERKQKIKGKQGNIIFALLKQVRIGMDLNRITLPTFILEPRSFLERFSDFLIHTGPLNTLHITEDPMERMLKVLDWYFAGWHLTPAGVKKPYNPIYGETFRACFNHMKSGNGITRLITEQVSHHPPISAYYAENRKLQYYITGHIYPKSKFLGNSAASLLTDSSKMDFHLLPFDEHYFIQLPDYYARGVVIGSMYAEVAGKPVIYCKETGIKVKVEFLAKGFFKGNLNEIKGEIYKDNKLIYNFSGYWDDKIHYFKKKKKNDKQVLFDLKKLKYNKMYVPPIEEQDEFESRRLWKEVTKGLKNDDVDYASKYKFALETKQREDRKVRKEDETVWETKYFDEDENGNWIYKYINKVKYQENEEIDPPFGKPGIPIWEEKQRLKKKKKNSKKKKTKKNKSSSNEKSSNSQDEKTEKNKKSKKNKKK